MKTAFTGLALAMALVSASVSLISAQTKIALDTTYGEGAKTTMTAVVQANVTGYWWTVVGGIPYRILDPEAKTQQLSLPRVTKKEYIRFRFMARTKTATDSQDIIVRILDDVPDPLFTLPATQVWDGQKPITLKPAFANLNQIKACRFPSLRYRWTVDSLPADTAWMDSSLVLKSAYADGHLLVKLCVDNGGAQICQATLVTVKRPAVSAFHGAVSQNVLPTPNSRTQGSRFWRADGRLVGNPSRAVHPLP